MVVRSVSLHERRLRAIAPGLVYMWLNRVATEEELKACTEDVHLARQYEDIGFIGQAPEELPTSPEQLTLAAVHNWIEIAQQEDLEECSQVINDRAQYHPLRQVDQEDIFTWVSTKSTAAERTLCREDCKQLAQAWYLSPIGHEPASCPGVEEMDVGMVRTWLRTLADPEQRLRLISIVTTMYNEEMVLQNQLRTRRSRPNPRHRAAKAARQAFVQQLAAQPPEESAELEQQQAEGQQQQ